MKQVILFFLLLTTPLIAVQPRKSYDRNEPWLTEKSILFLTKFLKDRPNAHILEFGCGASTIWLAKRTKNLTSIEHNETFTDLTQDLLKKEQLLHVKLITHPRPYYLLCTNFKARSFDLIIVDGRDRVECLKHSANLLKPGGVLMLDNAERPRYQNIYRFFKKWPLTKTEQKRPDKFGFWYKGWQTNWWIKPIRG